jgi:hypothetical protein
MDGAFLRLLFYIKNKGMHRESMDAPEFYVRVAWLELRSGCG